MDRLGVIHNPNSGDIVINRKGAFAVIILNNQILVTAGPHAPHIPELPDGGLDEDEKAEQALIREIYEETGLRLIDYRIQSQNEFDIKFYADDKNEYWDYSKEYFELSIDKNYFFDGKKQTPENGFAWWENFENISMGSFRSTDVIALKNLGYI